MGSMRRLAIAMAVLVVIAAPLAMHAPHPAAAQGASAAVEGEILVRFRPGLTAASTSDVHRQNGGQPQRALARTGVQVVRVPRGQERALAAAYRRNPNVLFAEPNGIYRVVAVPNDARAAEQWQYQNTGQSGGAVDADIDLWQAWDITEGNASVAIAILDTGIDQSHEDLASKITRNINFSDEPSFEDGHGHGTHVAGTAAAATNNGIGVAGVCPKCVLYNVKVMDNQGQGTWEQIANGIIWAADNGAKVISLSLGGTEPSATLEAAVDYAWSQGAVVVAAAGNDGTAQQFYPAAYSHVIAVGATTHTDAKASFSNYGASWVDVAAPGENILSTAPDHFNAIWFFGVKYGTISGTSMATPHVAGVAGLVWSSGLCADNACVRGRIESTTDPKGGVGTNWAFGRVNACAAVGGGCNNPSSNQPPAVTFVNPTEGMDVTGTVAVQVRATDPQDASSSLVVRWKADAGTWQTMTYNAATGNHQASWNTASLAAGPHTLSIQASDTEGAVTTEAIAVTKDVAFTGTIAFGQSATVNIPAANEVALLRFDGAAGQRFALKMTNASIASASVSVLKPDGAALGTPVFAGTTGGFMDTRTLPAAGTYTIVVDPAGTNTGSLTVTLYDVPADLTGSVTPGGSPVTVTTTGPGQNARLTFNGSANQRVSVRMTNVTMGSSTCCGVYVSILKPDGTALVSPTFAGTNGGFIDAKTLTVSGTHTVVVDPLDISTGSMTLTLYDVPADPAPTITPGGAPATVAMTVPGQNARPAFSGTAGRQIALGVSGVTVGTSAYSGLQVSILKPDGTALVTPATFGTNGGLIDTRTLPVSGTYTIVVDPQGAATGSATLTLEDIPADVTATLTSGGPSVTVANTEPRQNMRVSFTGIAGQRVSVGVTGVTVGTSTCCGVRLSLLKPDGTAFAGPVLVGTSGGDVDTNPLPSGGTYTILVDPQDLMTGSVTLTLSTDLSGALSVGGAPVTLAIARPGQNGRLTFAGTAGQSVTVVSSGVTIGTSTCCGVDLTIYKPDGSFLTLRQTGTNGGSFTVQLPVAGTYTLVVDPWYAKTGSITLQLTQPVSGLDLPDVGVPLPEEAELPAW
jgi:subtilisin family serine protease